MTDEPAEDFKQFGTFRGEDLKRVLVAEKSGGQVRVQAIEFYDDGIIVRFFMPEGLKSPESPEDAMLDPMGGMSFLVTDDLGTQYKLSAMHSGGNGETARGDAAFVPAVPADATEITVVSTDGPVTISLAE